MEFEKWQGCGNDFVLIDRTGGAPIDDLDVKVIVARPSKIADVRQRRQADGV